MPVNSLQLVNAPLSGNEPIVSRDGAKVAFVSGQRLVVHSGLTNQVIDFGSGTVSQPEFAPDANRVVLTYTPTSGPALLRIVDLTTGTVTEPSIPSGALGEANSASFSSDGTRIVFASLQALVPDDTNNVSDIYMLTLASGSVLRISATAVGHQANGGSYDPIFSPDGNSIAFESDATNLVPGDTNQVRDIYHKTWTNGAVIRLSLPNGASWGTGFNLPATDPVYAPNGSYVMFTVVGANANTVYYKTPGSITTTTVLSGVRAVDVDIAPDVSHIVYRVGTDLFYRTLATGVSEQIDKTPGGTLGNGQPYAPRFLPDGNGIVFASESTNLLAGDTSADPDIYIARLTPPAYRAVIGTAGDDIVAGSDLHNEILNGGAGADQMTGGLGSDTYIVDNAGDVVIENSSTGLEIGALDRVLASVSYMLNASADIEELAATDAASTTALDLTGSDTNNNIYGNDGGNLLSGQGGNDFLFGYRGGDDLYGGSGNDYLVGGVGFDLLIGGAGDDTYLLDDGADTIVELVGEGFDIVYAGFSFRLPAGPEIEMLSTGGQSILTTPLSFSGNEFGNILYANEGPNNLQGGDGADSLFGLGGGDSLLGDAGIDKLYGGNGADALLGGADDDELYGEAQNDLLDGGSGADFMAGGLNDDTYIVDNVGDVIRELPSQGFDRVFATTSYTLVTGAEVEILSAGGSDSNAAINLTGNEFNNNVYGNEGANTLLGGDGVDWLFGFGGNDTVYGDNGNDFLIAGTGADTLYGGQGNDVLQLDDATDVAIEAVSEGYDRVYVNFTYSLGAGNEIEEVTTGGNVSSTTALDIIGNEFGQIISGNAGANLIEAGGGDDRLFGFEGDDTLIGGAGTDRLYGGVGGDIMAGGADGDFFFFDAPPSSGADTVTDFVSGVDAFMLAGSQFSNISEGAFPARTFATGTQAASSSHRIIFDDSTGFIYFDPDGSGSGSAVHFATVSVGTTLTSFDFFGY